MQREGIKKRNLLSSPHVQELKKKKRSIFKKRFGISVLIVVCLSIALFFVSRIEAFNISKVEIAGTKVLESSELEKAVESELSGTYLFFLPKTNFLLLPRQNIKRALLDKWPRIESVDIRTKDLRTIEVVLTEREIKFLYCEASEGELAHNCYFMDKEGYIFDEAPYFSGTIYFKFTGPIEKKKDSAIGTYFLKEKFNDLSEFYSILKTLGLRPALLSLKEDGDIEVFLSAGSVSAESPKIIFNKNADLKKMADNLRSAIAKDPLRSKLLKNEKDLLYIDLRFGNKVYYKFK